MKTIGKSELARRLKVSPAMITAYIKRGMPVLKSGRVNFKAALAWHADSIVPERSGSFSARQRAKDQENIQRSGGKPVPAQRVPEDADSDRAVRRRLLDVILGRRNLVPAILAECGVKDPVLLHCGDDFFSALVLGLAGELDPYDWLCEDMPLVETDAKGIFQKYGLQITPELVAAADAMGDAAFEVVETAMKVEDERRDGTEVSVNEEIR